MSADQQHQCHGNVTIPAELLLSLWTATERAQGWEDGLMASHYQQLGNQCQQIIVAAIQDGTVTYR